MYLHLVSDLQSLILLRGFLNAQVLIHEAHVPNRGEGFKGRGGAPDPPNFLKNRSHKPELQKGGKTQVPELFDFSFLFENRSQKTARCYGLVLLFDFFNLQKVKVVQGIFFLLKTKHASVSFSIVSPVFAGPMYKD
ncbi:hypothetical protein HanPI659440_Chr13g0484191 [Helianthus annuus]|nr:hypothetical protein HanPI659440_Chr13g0484191 [Helianthus annuus]